MENETVGQEWQISDTRVKFGTGKIFDSTQCVLIFIKKQNISQI